ncbi:pilus assembly PilX N-terminal domain-containing protein [Halomonas alkalicola]|uniref:Pilus assembly PilX N-terminal domain-containing protein n=1 Tax=Halomonas alkalicola TaxID=1930622 RepID=A0ABY9H1Y3_9GAMM|nr:pilus assembly PilX N-terminal domain-containing protein [Halomonas alkalicola]WLI72481.1 pilus assembly PilX N-terminal domain-containing protein [Halomonas alkalicola]
MKTQKGAALVVVLSLLTISLMVGLSSIQSSQIDERLAGNYRASANAQMAAEFAASQGYKLRDDLDELSLSYVDEHGFEWQYIDVEKLPKNVAGRYLRISKEALESIYGKVAGNGSSHYILAEGLVGPQSGEVVRTIVVGIPGAGGGLDAVFNCFGFGCNRNRVSAAEGALDGNDHPVSGNPFNCQGNSCRYDHDPKLDSVADYFGLVPGDGSYPEKRAAWEDAIGKLPPAVVTYDGKGNSNRMGSHGTRENPVVIEVTGSVRINGGTATAGIIIVREGGSIERANGTAHHEGLIIVEEGGRFNISNGTFNLYGAVLKLKPEGSHGHEDDFDLNVGGNASLNYSSEALSNLVGIFDIESFLGGGSPDNGMSWREI